MLQASNGSEPHSQTKTYISTIDGSNCERRVELDTHEKEMFSTRRHIAGFLTNGTFWLQVFVPIRLF